MEKQTGEKQTGVYGENRERGEPEEDGVRGAVTRSADDKTGDAAALESARERSEDRETGEEGMGREETPDDPTSEGEWNRPQEGVDS
jgi:hypothetical protein